MKGPRRREGDPNDARLLSDFVAHLERGGTLGYPTETVYGLGARADLEGVQAVQALKGRSDAHPFLVLIPGEEHPEEGLDRWGLSWSPEARRLAATFWPGPLTMVLSDPEGRFPPGIRSAVGGVAVRVSSHPFVSALMSHWDRPLISTSANRSGEPPACTPEEFIHGLRGGMALDRLWIADGGRLPPAAVSTLLDLTGAGPRVLREGAISKEALLRQRTWVPDDD
ncbi:MAG: L-threonylcarbamoyladenylate synthase [Gemmatimonadota bacterium]